MDSKKLAEECLTLRQVYDRIGQFLDEHPESAGYPTLLIAHDEHILPTSPFDIVGLSYVEDKDSSDTGPWWTLTHLKYIEESHPPIFATLGWQTFDKELGAED